MISIPCVLVLHMWSVSFVFLSSLVSCEIWKKRKQQIRGLSICFFHPLGLFIQTLPSSRCEIVHCKCSFMMKSIHTADSVDSIWIDYGEDDHKPAGQVSILLRAISWRDTTLTVVSANSRYSALCLGNAGLLVHICLKGETHDL